MQKIQIPTQFKKVCFRQHRTKLVRKMRSRIFRQIAQKFRRHAAVCQGISVQYDGKSASRLRAKPSGGLCAVLPQKKYGRCTPVYCVYSFWVLFFAEKSSNDSKRPLNVLKQGMLRHSESFWKSSVRGSGNTAQRRFDF